jgi:hypothetical protein
MALRSLGLAVGSLLLSLIVSPPAWGWGPEGHVVVARVAEQHLSHRARDGILELIGTRSIADTRIANWADFIKRSAFYKRKYPNNATWHYIDLPLGVEKDKVAEYCQNHNCVIDAVKRFQDILRDPEASGQSRKEALFFLVHLVGDLHQPLHCATLNDDHGGNKRRVLLPGEDEDEFHRTNLHHVWDTELVQGAMGGLTVEDFADRLSAQVTPELSRQGSLVDVKAWVLESNRAAAESAYQGITGDDGMKGKPIALSPDYMRANQTVVRRQLQRAGVRLALVLNAAFE